MRKGRFAKEEIKYIEEKLLTDSPKDIAKYLDRDPESVENFIKKRHGKGASREEIAAFDLESRPYWPEVKQQFTEDEIKLFKYHWSRIISQFRDDVIPTEELQVIDLIKLELLMNRHRRAHTRREATRLRSGGSRRHFQHGASGSLSQGFSGISQQGLSRITVKKELDVKRNEGNS